MENGAESKGITDELTEEEYKEWLEEERDTVIEEH